MAERLNTSNFTDIREMDFPNLGIKNVDIGGGDVFTTLRRFEKLLSFSPTLRFDACCNI